MRLRSPLSPLKFAQRVHDLDCRERRFAPLVPGAAADAGERLFLVVRRQHSEDHRHPRVERDALDAAGRLRRHEVEVRRVAPDDGPEADDRFVVAVLGKGLRDDRKLETAWDLDGLEGVEVEAVCAQFVTTAIVQSPGYVRVKPRYHNRKPHARRVEPAFEAEATFRHGRPSPWRVPLRPHEIIRDRRAAVEWYG